ncbi:MAG: zinc ribbon domain-containing protein [Candidatus Thermoplasmatota archaeon]|nr:zinc ribbon domain-containing protein [Candidatus Thermoplasmatota archaeon]
MSGKSVVFIPDSKCSNCGTSISDYLQVQGDGKAKFVCPNCGSPVIREIVAGVAPPTHPDEVIELGGGQTTKSHYPGLYIQPRHAPRFDLRNMVMTSIRPTKSLTNLYLSTDLRHAIAMVLVFSVISTIFSVLITHDMAEVVGYTSRDAVGIVLQGVVGWIVTLLSFLIFGVVAALLSFEIFGGRGDKGSTLTLVAHCYPWFVVLSIILLSIFDYGFVGLDLAGVDSWADDEIQQAMVFGTIFLVLVLAGLVWILRIVSKAIGIANDISTGSAALCAILAGVAAGIIALIVGSFMRLPIGIIF